MKIEALRNIRVFCKGKYYNIKKDEELPREDIKFSEKELKTLSESPAFKEKKSKKYKNK